MNNYYMGQKVLFFTILFKKPYFWMQDGDGVVYLTKAKPTKFSKNPTAKVVDGATIIEKDAGWVPDFS